ncbi:MAG: hypothetical protein ACFFCQ_07785 [Promethearchaeota archaeon]
MSIPPTPLIEHAKTGRANCRKCHKQIKKDELRIGLPAFYRGHITYRWFHPHCLPKWGMIDLDLEMISSDDDKAILKEIIKKRPSRIPLAAITAETDFLITIEGRVENIEPKKVFQKKTTEKGYLQAGVITDGQIQRRIIGWNQDSDLIARLRIGKGYRFSYLQPVENRRGEIEFSLTRISQTEEIDFTPIKDIIPIKEVYISRSRTDKLYCLGCRRKISRGEFRIKKIDERTEKGRFYHLGCIDPQYLLLRVKEYLEDEKPLTEDKLDLHRRTERVISHRDPNLLPAFLELEIVTDDKTPESADIEN